MSDTFIRPIGEIVCRRTQRDPAFKRNDQVIRRTDTDEKITGNFLSYCEDSKYVMVFWMHHTEASKVPLSSIMHIADWKAAREQQAKLKDYWTK